MRVLALGALLAVAGSALVAETVARPGVVPIQAQLMADMNSRVLKVGSPVYAQVSVEWKAPNCVLKGGSILEAHVTSIVPYNPSDKLSSVNLEFTRAECGGQRMKDYPTELAAMAAPPNDNDLGVLTSALPLSTGGASGISALKTMQMMTNVNLNLDVDSPIFRFPQMPKMQVGQVSGIRHLTLAVGQGTENATTLTVKGHDVVLERHTLLLLIPVTVPGSGAGSAASTPSGKADENGGAETAGAASEPPADDIDLCVPPACSTALPSGTANNEDKAAATISLAGLGYAARPQRMMDALDHDEAMTYLGPRELLVAFNPHILATRHSLGQAGYTERIIRAADIDTKTRRILHSVDWELPDENEYLWQLPGDRALVHVGAELRVYGPGLKVEERIMLDGPLAFVRVAPNGNFITAGVVEQRHSAELRAALRDSVEDFEEDVNVWVLNGKLEVIARSAARSGIIAPTLLNEGQAKLLAQPNNRYRIAMLGWDNKAGTIAHFTSGCAPAMESLSPDLIFLTSCDRQTRARQYRVLHADGRPAMKSGNDPNDCDQAAKGGADGTTFVVKTVQSNLPAPAGNLFNAAEFAGEDLTVYRAEDGKRLLGVRVSQPSPSRDGFALSPDNAHLAVLTREAVELYEVPGS